MRRTVDTPLEELRHSLLRMGSRSEEILEKALRAFLDRRVELAREVPIDDLEIDRLDLAIDEAVMRLLALQAPVADDLRQVLAIKMIATDLERVGDLARNIAKSALRLADKPAVDVPPVLRELADDARRLLKQALDSFTHSDAKLARHVLEEDERVDAEQDRVIREAMEEIRIHPEVSSQEVDLILIAKHLERVADHATNIAEDVILICEARNVRHADKLEPDESAS